MSDLGSPLFFEDMAEPEPDQFSLPGRSSHFGIKNIGVNTLWLSFDGFNYFDVAVGTSYEDNMYYSSFWAKTLNGYTIFVFLAVMDH